MQDDLTAQPANPTDSTIPSVPVENPAISTQTPPTMTNTELGSPDDMHTPPSPAENPAPGTVAPLPTPEKSPSTETESLKESTVLPDDIPPMDAPKSKKRLIVGIATLLALILLSGTGVFAYMVTYQGLSTSNKTLDQKIAHLVQSLPFAPKTPTYILERAALAHQDVTSAEIDISLASENQGLSDMFGGNFELAVSGPVDYSDIDNPEIALNFRLDTAFEADITYTSDFMYFRLVKLPAILYTMLGLTEENIADNPLLNRWVAYDTSGLKTSAQELLDTQDIEEDPGATQVVDNQLEVIKRIFADELGVTQEDLDGTSMHKLTMLITPEVLERYRADILREFPGFSDADFEEMKQTLEKIDLTIYISQDTYLVHRFDMVSSVKISDFSTLPPISPNVLGLSSDQMLLAQANLAPTASDSSDIVAQEPEAPSPTQYSGSTNGIEASPSQTLTSAFVLKLSDHGKDFEILAPEDSTDYEAYMLEVSSYFQQIYQREFAEATESTTLE